MVAKLLPEIIECSERIEIFLVWKDWEQIE